MSWVQAVGGRRFAFWLTFILSFSAVMVLWWAVEQLPSRFERAHVERVAKQILLSFDADPEEGDSELAELDRWGNPLRVSVARIDGTRWLVVVSSAGPDRAFDERAIGGDDLLGVVAGTPGYLRGRTMEIDSNARPR